MKLVPCRLPGVRLIEPEVFEDRRGFFMEAYNEAKFAELDIRCRFVQDNHSLSAERGVLRGLHYQLPPRAQAKLVRVIRGEIYDVVVDLRRGSPTFGAWEGFVLSAENKRQLFVPRGFAHGFCTLAPNTEVIYKVDDFYAPELERGIAWNDPALGIAWPVESPILSDRDRRHPPLAEAEFNFTYSGDGS